MVFGLALVLALVLGVATMAFAANGNNFVLGVLTNSATDVTRLVGNVSGGPALQVVNNNTDAGSRALQLNVADGKAPMVVNATAGKATNLNADKLDGLSLNDFYSVFMSRDTYRNESAPAPGTPGTQLGDGTYNLSASCEDGDVLLSGGPANIDPETDLLESFPSGGNSWTARVQKNGFVDDYSVVVLCAWQ